MKPAKRENPTDLEQLEQERNLLRTLIDIVPYAMYVKDTSCRKIMANQVDIEFLGCSSEAEVLGKTDFDFLPFEVARAFYADDRRVLDTGEAMLNRDERYLDRHGRRRWVLTSKVPIRDVRGAVIGLAGIGHDLTELKEAEARIREQAQLLDIASDAIIVHDVAGRVRYWNRSAELAFGWAASEAIGLPIDELLSTRPGEQRQVVLREVIERGAWGGDLTFVAKAGRELVAESRLTLVRDEAGAPAAVLCVFTVVTERRALQAQLQRAQRLESLGILAGGLAHDLGNVLTPILMSFEALGSAITDPEARELLANIRVSAKRGANLIRQVLSFARGGQAHREELAIGAVVQEVAEIVREAFPPTITTAVDLPEGLWSIEGNATQLHQALMNLSVNARDAMPEGGRLSIRCGNVHLNERFARTQIDARPADYVMLEVTDSGSGMPPEVVEKIFDPFFTTKEPGRGTGLGLSMTLTIVKSHGGFITVSSEVGMGSSFRIYLPALVHDRAGLPIAPPPPSSIESRLPPGKDELILVVDDEKAVRETTRRVLTERGYRALAASGGREAIARFTDRHEQIRCLIVDLMMPDMDGETTIRALRELDAEVAIIATSGMWSSDSEARARELGAQAFLPKPFSTDQLLTLLREILE